MMRYSLLVAKVTSVSFTTILFRTLFKQACSEEEIQSVNILCFLYKCPFKLFQILLCVILFWTGKIDSRSVVPWQGCRNLQVSRIKRYLVCLTQGIELVYIWCPCVNEFLFIVIYLLIFVFQSCSIGKQQCPAQLNFSRWFLQGIRQLWTSLICYWPNMLECWSDYKEFCAVETYPSSSLLLQSSLIPWLSQSV